MKVLKEGRPQKGWSSEQKCSGAGNHGGGCGAKLLVEEDDLFETCASYMGRDEEWFTTFRCSACGVLTDIVPRPPIHNLPSRMTWFNAHGIEDKRNRR